jgi:microcystin-dependent protein
MPAVPAPVSGLPRFRYGEVLYGAKAYFFETGTTTPKLTYKDPAYSQEHPHPVEVDGEGNFPAIYVGIGDYDIRLVDGEGAVVGQLLQLRGALASDAPDDTGDVPDEKLAATGDLKHRYDAGLYNGWVRCNGRTIGSAVSGASERANADTEALFKHLWNKDPSLAVVPSRGATANADWTTNKTIALPDFRGRALVSLDDMGGAAAGRLAGGHFAAGGATTLGGSGGRATETLTAAQMPSHSHTAAAAAGGAHNHSFSGTTGADGSHAHTYSRYSSANGVVWAQGNIAYTNADVGTATASTSTTGNHAHTYSGATSSHDGHTHAIGVGSAGGDQAHNNLAPFALVTTYIKL